MCQNLMINQIIHACMHAGSHVIIHMYAIMQLNVISHVSFICHPTYSLGPCKNYNCVYIPYYIARDNIFTNWL